MTKRINSSICCLVTGLLIIFSSCSSDLLFTDSVNMPDNTWNLFNNPDFRVPVTDTAASANIIFTIRNGSRYPYRNIFLFVTISSPDGKTITDTLEYYLADDKGKWYGKGFGDIHELELPYKSNVFFPVMGTWHFKIQHGMRTGDLRGIYDFGLRVEKAGR